MNSQFPPEAEDWTATFIRLRSECLILSALIFLLSQVGLKLDKIPIVPVELGHDVPLGFLVVALNLAFSAVFLNALLRCRAELIRTGMPSSLFDEVKLFLQRTGGSLEEFSQAPPSQILQQLVDDLNRMAQREPTSENNDHVADIVQGAISDLSRISEIATTARIEIMAVFNKMIFRIEKMRSVFTWEKIIFGALLPLAASLLLVILAAPQSIVDAKPVLARAYQCVSNLERSCFYRQAFSINDSPTTVPLAPPSMDIK